MNENGQSMVEYALIIVLSAIILTVWYAVNPLATSIAAVVVAIIVVVGALLWLWKIQKSK